MNGSFSSVSANPFALALRYATAPYAQGTATVELPLGPSQSGTSVVLPYNFGAFQSQYGVQENDIVASYILTLKADQLSEPAVIEIDYVGLAGTGTLRLVVPAGSLGGTSFALAPLPQDPQLILLKVNERPAPSATEPSGPQKWGITVLLGNAARLLWVLSGESQLLAAVARDVKAQHHLATARKVSLDRIGQNLGVPRQLPTPYRLDFDQGTVALYHFDDAMAPVLDATHDFPGINVGALRGVPGQFGKGCQVTASGGVVIPEALAFAIDPSIGFTVEMFVNPAAPPGARETVVFAVKRPRFDQSDAPGWSLALEPTATGHDLAFTLTDSAAIVVRTAAANVTLPTGWSHVAGVVNPTTRQALVFLNGTQVGAAALGALGVCATGANIGLGADLNGVAHLNGSLDEVRFSKIARTDFSTVLGPGGQPYTVDAATIALYHFEETDDWIDEDSGLHFAVNSGAQRGVPARFGNGLRFVGDPLPRAHCPAERDFQSKLKTGAWDRTAGGAPILAGPYTRFGYRQGAISEPGLDAALHPVLVNDGVANDGGLVTTACYGFTPDDTTNSNDPSQTITKFQAAGRSVQEAIDYFGEWHGLGSAFFTAQYVAHGVTATHETCLPAPASPTSVTVAASADFSFDASASFTVEAFVRPDPVLDDYARAIVACRSSALRHGEVNPGEAGWALCLGTYRSIPNNLRWVVGDATGALVTVDANINLATDGAFHHVAGVVDRDVGVALLFIDGVEVQQAPLGMLFGASVGGPVVFGNCPDLSAPYAGLLDEIRISRVARRSFQPVLGEADDRYRQRLAIFQPWQLPAVAAVRRAVQALTLSDPSQTDVTGLLLGNDPIPAGLVQLDVDETDNTRFCASRWLRLIPQGLAPGQSIAADGTTPAVEPDAFALPPLASNSPALLSEADGANYSFSTPQSRLMVLAAAQALEKIAARLAVLAPGATLGIQSAYLPAAPGAGPTTNDNLGRALTLVLNTAVPGLDLGVLGALAFELGITYVAFQNGGGAPALRLVIAPQADLDLVVTGSNPGLDPDHRQVAVLNQPLTISINRPKPATGQALQLDWSVLPCDKAAGTLNSLGADPTVRNLVGTALGRATVQVRYTLNDGVTVLIGSLPILIAPTSLEGCDVLSGDGAANVTEASQSGLPDSDFRTDYLVTSNDPRVDYAPTPPPAPPSNLMQLPLETALLKLAVLAAREPGAPRITVQSAYDPNAANLQAVGRGMVALPSSANLTAARLGALAFVAGFSYIERRRYPPSVYLSVPQGDRFQIVSGPLKRLWANARISGRGELMAMEFDAAGPPDLGFNPLSLQLFTDPRASFASGVSNLVQPSLATAATALLNNLAADGIVGTLQVVGGFVAKDPSLLGVGRAWLVRHPAVAADRLSGYALQAGFGFVQHRTIDPGGPAVYLAAYPAGGAPLNLVSAADLNSNYLNVYLDTLIELGIRPQLGVKARLDWSVQAACPAAATLSSALPEPTDKPRINEKVLTGIAAGAAAAVASFSLRDFSEPYQFRIVPSALPGSGAPAPRLSKDQYDDLLNLLDAYHPVGAEAVTAGLRAFVHGFRRPPRWDRLPTAATFVHYRVHP
jgi:hypothetical protein